VLGVPAALVGLRDISNANPVLFMLGLLWVFIVSIRLAVKPGVDEIAPAASADDRVAVGV
jgi:hypothetical protein